MKHWKVKTSRNSKFKSREFTASDFKTSVFPINLDKFKINTKNSKEPEKLKKLELVFPKPKIRDKAPKHLVLAWGNGTEGALGVGKLQYTEDPIPVPALTNVQVKSVACGAGNTLVLTADSRVYAWGYNSVGQLGLGDFIDRWKPVEVTTLRNMLIDKLAAGAGHCMVICSQKVYSWGSGGFYQTGHFTREHITTPKLVEVFEKVKDVSCGVAHSIVLCEEVYCVGDNQHGQCTGKKSYYKFPKKLSLQNCLKVEAGGAHSLFLCKEGLYACGLNSCGQLGTGKVSKASSPKKVTCKCNEEIIHIEAGEESSGVITSKGRVYVWGWNGCGQLGQGHFSNLYYPTLLNFPPVKSISLGVSASLIVTCSSELYIAGWVGEYKQLKKKFCSEQASLENSYLTPKNLICMDSNLACPRKVLEENCFAVVANCGRTHAVVQVNQEFVVLGSEEKTETIDHTSPVFISGTSKAPLELEQEPSKPFFPSPSNAQLPNIRGTFMPHKISPSSQEPKGKTHNNKIILSQISKEKEQKLILEINKRKEEAKKLVQETKLYPELTQASFSQTTEKDKKSATCTEKFNVRDKVKRTLSPGLPNQKLSFLSPKHQEICSNLKNYISKYDKKLLSAQQTKETPHKPISLKKRIGGGFVRNKN
mgnify:FL=1